MSSCFVEFVFESQTKEVVQVSNPLQVIETILQKYVTKIKQKGYWSISFMARDIIDYIENEICAISYYELKQNSQAMIQSLPERPKFYKYDFMQMIPNYFIQQLQASDVSSHVVTWLVE